MRAICQYCDGDGFMKSPRTMCNEIYRKLAEFLQQKREKLPSETKTEFKISLNSEVLERMKNDENVLIPMEKKFNAKLLFRSDSSLHIEGDKIADVTKIDKD
ncbi:MAG: hypothetical protein LBQ23_01455 [Puniceicoccales bacterium]|jgi:Ribonuclease G/E|nr:hypothetical protein [Puniceicoccales bacterium]